MRKISTKLFLISLVSIIFAASVILVPMMGMTEVISELAMADMQSSMNTVESVMEHMRVSTLAFASIVAQNPSIGAALSGGDGHGLALAVDALVDREHTFTQPDFMTITNADGAVVLRSHSGASGDNIADRRGVYRALGGLSTSDMEPNGESALGIVSTVPVISDGRLVGTVSVGLDMGRPEFVDYLQRITNTEITVFAYDVSIMTTLMSETGERIYGVAISPHIAEVVLGERRIFYMEAEIAPRPGELFLAYYKPFLDDTGEVLGLIFVGQNLTYVRGIERQVVLASIAIAIVLIGIVFFVSRVINNRLIVLPVKQAIQTVTQLSEGNLDIVGAMRGVRSRDELGLLSDRTRKLAVNVLQKQQIFDANPVPVSLWDADLNVLDCNEAMIRVLKLPSKDPYKHNFFDFAPQYQPCGTTSVQRVRDVFDEALEQGHVQFTWMHRDADGDIVPGEVNLVRIDQDDGYIFSAYMQDLRPLREVALKMQQAQVQAQLMLEATPMAVTLFDKDCAPIECNQAAVNMFGASSKDEYLNSFSLITAAKQPDGESSDEYFREYVTQAFDYGYAYLAELHCQKLDGTPVIIHNTYIRIRYRDEYAVIEYSQDITEKMAAVDREREATQRQQQLYDANPIPACLFDGDMQIVECNKAAAELVGVSRQEYMSRFLDFSAKHQPCGTPTIERMTQLHKEVYEKGRAHTQWTQVHSNGEHIPGELTSVLINLDDSQMTAVYFQDLRPLREADSKFREAEENNEMLLDACPMFIEIWDEDLNLIDCNQRAAEFFGLDDKEDFAKRYFVDLLPTFQPCGTSSTVKTLEEIKKALDTGYNRFERMYVNPTSGENMPVESTFVKLTRGGKHIIVGYNHDLRQVKSAMERERETDLYTRKLLDNSPMFMAFWDKEGNLLDCNQRLMEVFGATTKSEVITNFFDLSTDQQPCGTPSIAKNMLMINAAMEKGFHQCEWIFVLPNGEELPTEATYVHITHQGEPMVVVYSHDMRPVKTAMAKMREMDERAKVMIEGLPMPCYLLDADLEVVDCNQATVELFAKKKGVPFDHLLPGDDFDFSACKGDCVKCERHLRDACPVRFYLIDIFNHTLPGYDTDPEKAEKLMAIMCARAMEEDGIYSFETELLTLYGELIPCEVTIVAVKYQGEQSFACYVRDMRETRLMLEEMQRRQVAEEESRAKTRFLARMSHEIRTPMNAVLGVVEIMLQKDDLEPDAEDAFLRIHNSSHMLLSIINDILDLSKVEAGKMEIIPGRYDVASLIVDTVQLNLMHVGSKSILFALRADEDLPTFLYGDELRIKQILNNLLSNAFKYTSEGAVTLSFNRKANPKSDEITLIIGVSDTGQGMTQEQSDHLFDIEFMRFNMKHNRGIEGSGLGMSITYQLIKMMGGDIYVESEPGVGSSFEVHIPQKIESDLTLGRETVENLQNLDHTQHSVKRMSKMVRDVMPYGRVLVVDDVESNLFVAKGLMMPYKIVVETADSGYAAVDKIKEGKVYDIIFMDHMMPGMDGIQTVKVIRDMGYDQPIVALTANTVMGQVEMFMQNGFSGFISKPIDPNLLDAYLVRFIRGKGPLRREIPAELGSSVMEAFMRDAKKAIDALEPLMQKQSFNSDDMKNYTTYVHAMKSALGNVGQNDLADVAATLEEAGRKKDIVAIMAETPHFLDRLVETMEFLELFADDAVDDGIDEDLDFLNAQFRLLHKACEAYDKSGAKKILQLLEQSHGSQKTKILLSDISAHMLHSDLDAASACAQKWFKDGENLPV